MTLNQADRENIEVLESLNVDENILIGLLCRYFNYRYKRSDGRYGNTPDQALRKTILSSVGKDQQEQQA